MRPKHRQSIAGEQGEASVWTVMAQCKYEKVNLMFLNHRYSNYTVLRLELIKFPLVLREHVCVCALRSKRWMPFNVSIIKHRNSFQNAATESE